MTVDKLKAGYADNTLEFHCVKCDAHWKPTEKGRANVRRWLARRDGSCRQVATGTHGTRERGRELAGEGLERDRNEKVLRRSRSTS